MLERTASGFLPSSATVVQHLDLGSVQFTRTHARLPREPGADYRDPGDALVWAFVLRGSVSVRQARAELDTDPGLMSVKHFRRPTSFRYTPDFQALSIRMDAESLGLGQRTLDALSSVAFPVVGGVPRMLWAMASSALENAADLTPATSGAVARSAVDFTTAFVDDFVGRLTPTEVERRNVVALALRHIEVHAADPRLTPARVAEGVHVSLRSLQKAFRACSRSVAGSILDARLARAARLLAGSAPGIPVELIAERSGFTSPARFSRAFRERYEATPTQWRQEQAVATVPRARRAEQIDSTRTLP
ncbi:AraC family transcriptional regulator [Nocardioides sp. BP30]|uniref:AraC family transcriptional regulator n=1 Tax=Nocardioides sp. BP30 TaxID=3036374 RepID=UPI0024682AA5|nr:AraC family transcriptional regulator [Nocardioides sp. BP30]WGL51335.1 AraC family transcriptional regulator [Nocardioides sp. BP30]